MYSSYCQWTRSTSLTQISSSHTPSILEPWPCGREQAQLPAHAHTLQSLSLDRVLNSRYGKSWHGTSWPAEMYQMALDTCVCFSWLWPWVSRGCDSYQKVSLPDSLSHTHNYIRRNSHNWWVCADYTIRQHLSGNTYSWAQHSHSDNGCTTELKVPHASVTDDCNSDLKIVSDLVGTAPIKLFTALDRSGLLSHAGL